MGITVQKIMLHTILMMEYLNLKVGMHSLFVATSRTLISNINAQYTVFLLQSNISYSVSTNFCLELIEPSVRKVFIFVTLVNREDRGVGLNEERRKYHG